MKEDFEIVGVKPIELKIGGFNLILIMIMIKLHQSMASATQTSTISPLIRGKEGTVRDYSKVVWDFC